MVVNDGDEDVVEGGGKGQFPFSELFSSFPFLVLVLCD